MTAILAVVLVAVIGFPSYSAPAFRVLVTLLAVVGAIGGVALFLGKSIGTLPALLFLAGVVVFGLLVLIQGATSPGALGAMLRYQIFTTLPAAVLGLALYRVSRGRDRAA